ncbi:MAG: DUF2318 domain-containing protein [Proteobacteria bacterium]|nr:DUF2318 domain-containing protein [Pseudomonadota bacterium]MBU1686834.1 DUF2318 domain-containing protein [Pseudomonadota bacterium]
MKIFAHLAILAVSLPLFLSACSTSSADSNTLNSVNGELSLPLASVSDGQAHFFKVKADDGTLVTFFVLKSRDGIVRAAVDACDVCYKAGKGYHQEGDFMVCDNCGQRFASSRINEVKGGCNPAPLSRTERDGKLVIQMKDINANSWYMKYRRI